MLQVLPTVVALLLLSKADLAMAQGRIRLHRPPQQPQPLLRVSKHLLANRPTSELLRILHIQLEVGHPVVILSLNGTTMDKAVHSSRPITPRITPTSAGIPYSLSVFNHNHNSTRSSNSPHKSCDPRMSNKALHRKFSSRHHSLSHHSSRNHRKLHSKFRRRSRRLRPRQAHKELVAVSVSTTSTSWLSSVKVTLAKSCWPRRRQRRSCMLSRF